MGTERQAAAKEKEGEGSANSTSGHESVNRSSESENEINSQDNRTNPRLSGVSETISRQKKRGSSDSGSSSSTSITSQDSVQRRYGITVSNASEAEKIQRLESEHGVHKVQRWAEEGMTVDTMGKPQDMQAFRERQENRSDEIPTDIERRNQVSVERNVSRKGDDGPAGQAGAPDVVRDVISSPGTSMDETVQREMESKMGGDFSDVQLHTGPKAAAAADSINARAFTVGNNVAFNSGEYKPNIDDGKKVLAHELTHVRQQTEGRISMLSKVGVEHSGAKPGDSKASETTIQRMGAEMYVQPKLEVSSPDDPAEKEAEAVAERVVRMDDNASQTGATASEDDTSVQDVVQSRVSQTSTKKSVQRENKPKKAKDMMKQEATKVDKGKTYITDPKKVEEWVTEVDQKQVDQFLHSELVKGKIEDRVGRWATAVSSEIEHFEIDLLKNNPESIKEEWLYNLIGELPYGGVWESIIKSIQLSQKNKGLIQANEFAHLLPEFKEKIQKMPDDPEGNHPAWQSFQAVLDIRSNVEDTHEDVKTLHHSLFGSLAALEESFKKLPREKHFGMALGKMYRAFTEPDETGLKGWSFLQADLIGRISTTGEDLEVDYVNVSGPKQDIIKNMLQRNYAGVRLDRLPFSMKLEINMDHWSPASGPAAEWIGGFINEKEGLELSEPNWRVEKKPKIFEYPENHEKLYHSQLSWEEMNNQWEQTKKQVTAGGIPKLKPKHID